MVGVRVGNRGAAGPDQLQLGGRRRCTCWRLKDRRSQSAQPLTPRCADGRSRAAGPITTVQHPRRYTRMRSKGSRPQSARVSGLSGLQRAVEGQRPQSALRLTCRRSTERRPRSARPRGCKGARVGDHGAAGPNQRRPCGRRACKRAIKGHGVPIGSAAPRTQ